MKKISIVGLILFLSIQIWAQGFPERPNPPRLINDFANILSEKEERLLEEKLVVFDSESSTQITIVTVNDLLDYDVAEYGVRLAQEWGIGQKDKDNGILITVKPKNESQGRINLAIGYGLEGVVPDAVANRIIDTELIPEFINNNFYKGLDKATNVLISLTKGEYTGNNYLSRKPKNDGGGIFGGIFGLIFMIFILKGIFGRRRYSSVGSRSNLPFWIALGMLSGGRSHGGSFNSFSSGSGSFGGFGGGSSFGGFGGGSFGGGGASGSW